MKKIVFIFITTMLLTACTSDSNPEDGLPKETQTGADTFGCLIDGKLYKPRCEKPSVVFPESALMVWGGIPNTEDYSEIEVHDLKSEFGFNLILHVQNVYEIREGNYVINESNGENSIDGLNHTYLHCIVYDNQTNSYKKYISFENSGVLNITRYTIGNVNPPTGNIISGTFSCTLKNIDDSNDKIEVTKGRFDINTITCIYKEFR